MAIMLRALRVPCCWRIVAGANPQHNAMYIMRNAVWGDTGALLGMPRGLMPIIRFIGDNRPPVAPALCRSLVRSLLAVVAAGSSRQNDDAAQANPDGIVTGGSRDDVQSPAMKLINGIRQHSMERSTSQGNALSLPTESKAPQ